MKILIISTIWPRAEHSTRAANIVIYEMLLALVREPGASVGLLVVGNSDEVATSENERKSIAMLRNAGVDILDPIVLSNIYKKRPRWKRLLFPIMADWYPACSDTALIANAVNKWGADAFLIPWSEWLTHACAEIPVLKFAYYGNPDPKAARTQLRLRYRSGEISRVRKLFEDLLVNRFERLHLQTMQRYDLLGDVAQNDAQYYTRHGHKNAFYIQNIWMESPIKPLQVSDCSNRQIKIIGSIGKLGGTANRLGLEYLGNQVLPALDDVLGERPYEVHIIGSGAPDNISAKALNHPSVVWRGFVENIDEEIQGCDVFLCVNNATEYKVGHTRYLHAWSLSAPVVAHCDASLSMPEIENNVNALLGGDAVEIAEQIGNLIADRDLRKRIKSGGLETFNSKFRAKSVAGIILSKLNAHMSSKSANQND